METKQKLSGFEKFAYGLGAVGKDMVYMLTASYILYYYQDILGIEAWIMGLILLIARVFDAFNDPIMGVIVAKTKTRWGKFRPWLFIGTVTNAVILFLMFACPPSLDGRGLVAYAAVFYIIWGVTYTMMDIPYWSMVPAFTEGGKERESLSTMARSCAGLGSAIVTVITVISVSAIGTAINNSSASNTSYTYDNTTVYFAKMDESEVATGDILKVDSAVSNVTADEMEFDDNKAALSFNESNSNYVVTVDGVTRFTNDGSKLDFTKDAEKDSEASVAIFVQEEEYSNLSSGSEVTVNVVSTKQVERYGFKYFSLIIAVLFIICTLVTCVVIKEKSTVDVSTPSVGEMFKSLIKNDQAITMVVTIVLVNSAAYITANLLIYFFKYDLAGPSWETNYTMFITFIGAVQIIAMMLFFPLLRKYFTTMKVFDISILSGVIGYLVLLGLSLFEINNVFAFFVPGFFIMSTVGLLNVIVTVFLANTVDYGQLKNGHRDESVIFSMQTFVVKLASGIAAMVVSITLSVFHISDTSSEVTAVDGSVVKGLEELLADIAQNGGSEVSNNDIMGLRMTMTLAPIVFLVIAFLIFKKYYMLTDQELEKISAQLKERQND